MGIIIARLMHEVVGVGVGILSKEFFRSIFIHYLLCERSKISSRIAIQQFDILTIHVELQDSEVYEFSFFIV